MLPGAEAPKLVMPRESPSRPTYLAQPSGERASMESRALRVGGKTESRYDEGCWSKISQLGMETTRVGRGDVGSVFGPADESENRTDVPSKTVCAAKAKETSDPVAIN